MGVVTKLVSYAREHGGEAGGRYECQQCGLRLDERYHQCPQCGSYRVERTDWEID
jgi:lipopolysaccharide biosynthesis regulator YciM